MTFIASLTKQCLQIVLHTPRACGSHLRNGLITCAHPGGWSEAGFSDGRGLGGSFAEWGHVRRT
ncbi:hypothetical protein B0H34DRAFT_738517 [Crassisporium funariophilum]|nr:hypothetical protein B0H34DRAFT_738517 [Crassisporium funariophilum]